MRRLPAWLVAVVVVMVPLAGTIASAHCGDDSGDKAHDPFGSCETASGNLRCAQDATDVGGAFRVSTARSGYGAQLCNDGSDVPIYGRAGVHGSERGATAGVDGDKDMQGSNGWTRVDATTDGCVRVRRGSGNGSYYTHNGGTSTADAADQRVCA